MDLQELIAHFAAQPAATEAGGLAAATIWGEGPAWSSRAVRPVVATVDEACGVTLKGDGMRNASTAGELFHRVQYGL